MDIETIGKVKMNLSFYSGNDAYSDGDIEDRLLEITAESTDYEEFLTEESEWPVLYHLSDIRKNLLEWYDFGKEKTLLEIGAGCGAITGLFCEKTKKVTAIELSKRRSTINAQRNKDYDNLEIYVGNFEDIKLDEKFDYVTLIGVLEYSPSYIKGENPFHEMLRKVKEFLKPNGKLIVAIENKYGIKYWSGAAEDHTGRLFDGITGYGETSHVETFSKKGLEKLLSEAGFGKYEFYYPFPDYKLPLEIYSQDRLPHEGAFKLNAPSYDRERLLLFNEVKAMDSLIRDGMIEEFANSFLVICE